MIFNIEKASDWNYKETKEISTLEELIAFRNSIEKAIILTSRLNEKNQWETNTIIIYDDYIE